MPSYPYRRGQYDFTSRPPVYDCSQYKDSLLFVWLLTFGLPGAIEPTGTDASASTDLWIIAARKPDHHVKVAAVGREMRPETILEAMFTRLMPWWFLRKLLAPFLNIGITVELFYSSGTRSSVQTVRRS